MQRFRSASMCTFECIRVTLIWLPPPRHGILRQPRATVRSRHAFFVHLPPGRTYPNRNRRALHCVYSASAPHPSTTRRRRSDLPRCDRSNRQKLISRAPHSRKGPRRKWSLR